MCSYTFSQIQDTSDEHFKFERYELNKEYFDRPALPPPLIVIMHVFFLVRWLYRMISKQDVTEICSAFSVFIITSV